MQGLYLKITISLFFIFTLAQVNAQRSNGLAVEGKISTEEGSADGAIIQMYQDGRRLDNYGVGADGRYKVELNYNHKFELIFERENNFSQKIVVETAVPNTVLQSDPKFPPFPVDINLFTEIPGIDKSFSQKTVLKIYYNPNVDNFISELYYNDAQIKILIDQAIAQSKLVGKESDYLSKLTRSEIAELRREYNKLLEQAGKQYAEEQFLAALDGFKAASKIFPSEQFPKDRIAEINDLLGIIMAAADLDQALAARFAELIKEADLLFSQKNHADARNLYNRALSIKPADDYALKQVDLITTLLREQQAETQYQELIAQGDNSFREILYNEAIKNYQDALQLKPNENYPKNKIEEINAILADQANNLQKQENYDQAMFQAESLFERQFYEKSLASYQNALNYKPEDPAATEKIDEIRVIMHEIVNRMAYDKFIKAADKNYKKKLYPEALVDYKKAFELFPDESHPKNRIDEINQILDLKESFADLVYKADNQFISENYEASKSLYQQALTIQNNDKYSLDRIREIDRILAGKNADGQYNSLIAQADNLFANNNYQNAIGSYNEALSIKPREKYPKDKISEINSILQQIAKTDQQYDQAIAKADELFQKKDYENARTAYTEASIIKPEEVFPPDQIVIIDGLIAEQAQILADQKVAEEKRLAEVAAAEAASLAAIQAEKDKNYTDAIAKADNLFANSDYESSRTEYRLALNIKPDETYPQDKITEIGTLLAQLSASQKAYEDAVSVGDREFRREGFDAAIVAFNEAKQAKSDETYPDEMLSKIDSIVTTRAQLADEAAAAETTRLAAIQAEQDKNYTDAIAKADNLFNASAYENARTEYRLALDIKPEETYPQDKITEIGTLLAQLSVSQKAYEDAVSVGDREFRREGFDAAIVAFNEAKQAKSDETYPDEMLSKIDSIVTTRAQLAEEAAAAEVARLAAIQAEKDKNYTDAIAKADNLFANSDYESSRTEYRLALDIKPEETYPQDKITEIGTLLAQLSASQKAYEDAVTVGDREFRREGFDAAMVAFNEAKQAKSDETYPDEMLSKIDSIVTTRAQLAEEAAAAEVARLAAIQAENDKNYADAIAKADNLFANSDYESSRTEYRTALDIKPDETYPQDKITEIGTLLAQLSASQKAYEDAVSVGDREFRREGFDAAIVAFNEAKQAKSDETYPDEMLSKIDSIVTTRARLADEAAAAEVARLAAIQAEKDKNYADAIAKADNLFANSDYESSRSEYRLALDIKPEETYPQERIDEITKRMQELALAQKEQELLNKNYANFIRQADQFFTSSDFLQSKSNFENALELKPNEEYPKVKIVEIQQILDQQKLDEEYRSVIVAADGFFKSESYIQAKGEYEKALTIKSEEQYPKSQISKIEDILEKESQRILAEKAAAEDLERRRQEIAQMNTEIDAKNVESDVELNELYQQYIQKADLFFNSKQYNVSRAWYFQALDVKANAPYPTQKIEEINSLVGGLLLSQRDRDYQGFIDLADSTFRNNDLAVARGWYNRALGVKANEDYPKNQIAEIQKKIAERMAGQAGQQFDANVEKASKAFDEQNYNVARFWYKKAAELRPNDVAVKARLLEIENVLN